MIELNDDGTAVLLVPMKDKTRKLVFSADDADDLQAILNHVRPTSTPRKRRTKAQIDADKAAETAAKAEGAALAAAAVERSRSAAEATRSSISMRMSYEPKM